MKINIETYDSNEYNKILTDYGEILSRFGLFRTEENNAGIIVECLEDLFRINRELEKFINESDMTIPYFGIMIKSYDDGSPYLEIKDNYS